ncbi:MAG TPA: metallophosphoesterase, partial [Myxococcota bacterium]|nr:metallophosphoesterase [Myxococcota bacterium]
AGPGEPRLLRDELLPGYAPPSSGRRSLWLVLHESDAQLADAESPTRMVSTDAVAVTESAARPQELYAIHALDAQIRTANRLSALAPIDFALCTGDNADSNQRNELAWFAAVWDGQPVRPDAGEPGAQPDLDGNDPIAMFVPEGADFPWYAVAGNHDVLVQGNFLHGPWVDAVRGREAPLGTRDLSAPGGPLTYDTPPDPERAVLERSDIAALLLDGPDLPGPRGHGFSEDDVARDAITWVARPVGDVPVTLIAVDGNPDGPGDATLTDAERDGWLVPQLDAAQARGDLIVLTSHYAMTSLRMSDGRGVGDLLLGYPNVVLVIAGHTHTNAIRPWGPAGDPAAFWEITTSSTIDWPAQARLIELVDNGDGTLSVLTTMFDHGAPPGSLAARARELALIDLQSGWRLRDGSGEARDRNAELVQSVGAWRSTAGLAGVRSEGLP